MTEGPPNMPSDAQLKFMQDKLEQNKTFFRARGLRSKRMWFVIRAATILISGIVTVVLGLKATPSMPLDPDVTANVALVLSAAATFLVAAEAIFDARWNWINADMTKARIYGIEDAMNYRRVAGTLTQDDLDRAFTELNDVLQGVNTRWQKRRERDGGAADG